MCLAVTGRHTLKDQVSATIAACAGAGGCIGDFAVFMPAHQGRPKRVRSDAPRRRAQLSMLQAETFLARSIRGLEWLSAAEIEADLNAAVLEVGHREKARRRER